jgi:DNA-binding transcriptional ArsR family regulator
MNMVNFDQIEQFTVVFRALADSFRLRLYRLVLRWPGLCICDLTGISGKQQYNVSRAMRELKLAGLVEERKEGRWSHLYPIPLPVELQFLEQMGHWSFAWLQTDEERGNEWFALKAAGKIDLCSPSSAIVKRRSSAHQKHAKKSIPRGESHAPTS